MVPGIGLQGCRLDAASTYHSVVIEALFEKDGDDGRPESKGGREGTAGVMHYNVPDIAHTIIHDHDTHHQKHYTDGDGCKGLVFAMAIVVVVVARTGCKAHEYEHHDVADKIGEGMHSISHHSRRPTQNSCYKLKGYEQKIDDASHDGDAVYDMFALLSIDRSGGGNIFRRFHIPITL